MYSQHVPVVTRPVSTSSCGQGFVVDVVVEGTVVVAVEVGGPALATGVFVMFVTVIVVVFVDVLGSVVFVAVPVVREVVTVIVVVVVVVVLGGSITKCLMELRTGPGCSTQPIHKHANKAAVEITAQHLIHDLLGI
jgi:hypothetical protein